MRLKCGLWNSLLALSTSSCKNALEQRANPEWAEEVKSKKVDYNLDEVGRALHVRLGEIKPGLPGPGSAASLDAVSHCSPEVKSWMEDPSKALLPQNQWLTTVPKARVQVESHVKWEAIVGHRLSLGIVVPIDDEVTFTVGVEPCLMVYLQSNRRVGQAWGSVDRQALSSTGFL